MDINRHFNRTTPSVLGKTTTDLNTERILLEAQRILSYSMITVAEVAGFLGYGDHSYFSRMLRKKFLEFPSDFSERYY